MVKYRLICRTTGDAPFDYYIVQLKPEQIESFFKDLQVNKFIQVNGIIIAVGEILRIIPQA